MRRSLLLCLSAFVLAVVPKAVFGQSPNLGSASSFALYTSAGELTNNGLSTVDGDIGTYVGALNGFPPGVVTNGVIYYEGNSYLAQVMSDLSLVYSDLMTRSPDDVLGATLGNGEVLAPGVYSAGAALQLNGVLTLDGQNDPNALFIFQVDGAFSTTTSSSVVLINGASPCNVYWQITGATTLGVSSIFQGSIVSGGAIELLEGAVLYGRGLTKAGAIILHANEVIFRPAAAGTITGAATVCQGEVGLTYTIPAIPRATSYVWTVPTGVTVTAGATTESITVDFSKTATSGNISVYGTSSCGNGEVSPLFSVTVHPLPTTSLIYHL